MRQVSRRGLLVLLVVVIAGCGQVNGAAPQTNLPAASQMSLTDLRNVGDLRARFSQDAGKPRLLLLVSPT
jgi:hypothetical protein